MNISNSGFSSPKKHDAKSALLQAGVHLFGRYGLDGVTTRVLADQAGVNLSAIKYYFGGKDQYYRSVLQHLLGEVDQSIGKHLEALVAGIAESSRDIGGLRRVVSEFINAWCHTILLDPRTQRRMPFIMRELIRPTDNFNLVYCSFFHPLHAAMQQLIVASPSSTAIDATVKVKAQSILNQLLGFVIMEAVLWEEMGWEGYDEIKVRALVPPLQDTFLRAVGLEVTSAALD